MAFHYPSGAAADSQPTRLEIKSKQPLRVVLKEHDVRPRDTAGAVLEWTTRLISKVAETADITLDIGATPRPWQGRSRKSGESIMRPNLSPVNHFVTILAAMSATTALACEAEP